MSINKTYAVLGLGRYGKAHLQFFGAKIYQHHAAAGKGLSAAVHIVEVFISTQREGAAKPVNMRGSPRPIGRDGASDSLFHLTVHRSTVCRLGRENLAAAQTTGLQDVAAGLGLHAGTEAVNLGALTLLGLISTEHGKYTPSCYVF